MVFVYASYRLPVVSPCESGIVDVQPPPRIKRGLTLMCKIMQNIANHVLFTKELHMRPFNDFLKTNFDSARRFVQLRGLFTLCLSDKHRGSTQQVLATNEEANSFH